MTMIKAVGAEFNTLLELDGFSATLVNVSSTQKRGGGYSFGLWGGANFNRFLSFAINALSECFAQFCIYTNYSNTATACKILKWTNGSTVLGGLIKKTDGRIELYSGDFATLLGTSTNPISQSVWNVFEIHIKIANAPDGILQLRMNGSTEIDFSGDSQPGAATEINNFYAGSPHDIAEYAGFFDDIIINDINGSVNNSWPNGLKIVLLKPTADGNYSEWTPSSGPDNYALVDEIPPVITDYLTSVTDGERDTYVMENCPGGMGPIAAVIPTYWGQKSGTPACSNIKRLMRSGGVDEVSTNLALPTAYGGKVEEILEASPFTSLPFTVSEIDGMEFGQQSAT